VTAALVPAPPAARADGATPWLITFVDLVLRLLTFFILIFAMSRPAPERYAPIAQSYVDVFKPVPDREPPAGRPRSYVVDATARGGAMAFLETALKTALGQGAGLARAQFRSTDQYIIISLSDAVTADGSAVSGDLVKGLFDLGGVLANIDHRLAVIGLADAAAEPWAAALGRAAVLAEALARAGYDRPIATLARAAPPGSAPRRGVDIMIMPERTSPVAALPERAP
jgi:chemotaxis protein MotB